MLTVARERSKGLMVDRAVRHAAQVDVDNEPRKECALYGAEPIPARATAAWTRVLTGLGCSARGRGRLPLLTGRSTGLSVAAAAPSQVCRAVARAAGLRAGAGESNELGLLAAGLIFDRGRARTKLRWWSVAGRRSAR